MDYRRTNEPPDRPAGYYAKRRGSVVKLKECHEGYPLSAGLKAGERVKVVAFDHGYYTVERDGQLFRVFLANVV